nr:4Fe-4S binding protein [Lachnospiraceae bacterium]
MADLKVSLSGVAFKNPVIVASASATMDYRGVAAGIRGGASGAIVKSLFGEKGSQGRSYPRPRFYLMGYKDHPNYPVKINRNFTLSSFEECSHFGYKDYIADVNRAKAEVGDEGRVIASITGSTLEEWKELAQVINETDADWVDLNVSCPFAADLGVKMGAGAVDMSADITRVVKETLNKPFSVKVSPQTQDQSEVALACEKAGAYAINMAARISGFDLDIDRACPVGPGSPGGWGGPWLIGYGIKNVATAARKLSIPIIAGLGVWDWKDIIKYTMVGATLIQSGTGIMLQGYDVTRQWTEKIDQWLDAKGYSSLDEIRGIALPNILTGAQIERAPEKVFAQVDDQKCIKCGVCRRSCFYDAITMTKVGAVVDTNKCDGCGMCAQVCPADAVKVTRPLVKIS